MALEMVRAGSQYAITALDLENNYQGGGKNYKVNIPANRQPGTFGSMAAYDAQTRSMLQTDQQFPVKGTDSAGVQKNADGSYDI